jgi:hypothetical protein
MGEQFKENNELNMFLETSAKTGFNAKNVYIYNLGLCGSCEVVILRLCEV